MNMNKNINVDLFQKIDFISHSGLHLKWKIECDALSKEEWKAIATMIMDYQKHPFSKAVGIPRGGLSLADALNAHASGNGNDPVLICDDVFTTGNSILDFVKKEYPDWTMSMGYKWVVFARKPSYVLPFYTRALFTMPEKN
jgi:hypothetical protein